MNEQASAGGGQTAAYGASPPAHILVVDDNAMNLMAMEELLVGPGRVLVPANSGDAAVQEVQERPDGYAFRLPTDSEMLLLVAEDLNMERLCCPFLRFTLEIEPNGGPFWLRFTGGEGVKEFLRMSFESSNLLNEQVAQAAGFSIASRTELDSVETTIETISAVNERFAREIAVRVATED